MAEGAALGAEAGGDVGAAADGTSGAGVFAGGVTVSAEEQAAPSQTAATATTKVIRRIVLSVSGDCRTSDGGATGLREQLPVELRSRAASGA